MNMDNQNTEQEKKAWQAPTCSELSSKDTAGGGFGGNETTTTKPGS